MKNFINICLIATLALFFANCAKIDHAVNQKITIYPVIELTEGAAVAHQVGTPWVDPGYSATLEGVDITADVIVDDPVDGDVSGVYSISYSYVNVDGFEISRSRTVVVYDIANASTIDISGTYDVARFERYKLEDDSFDRCYNDVAGFSFPMKISKGPATGLFYMQDMLCGFYDQYYEYGPDYAYKAFLLLNTDNTLSLLNGDEVDPFGDPIFLYSSAYDPATGSVRLAWDWGSAKFYFVTYYQKS